MSGCPLFPFRADHHSWRGEHSPSFHRGKSEKGATYHQQRHAHWGQEEVLDNAFNTQGILLD